MNQPENEIWSEYARIKHELMDCDKNLRESIANIRTLMSMGYGGQRLRIHFLKAQKHVSLILDIGLSCGAIPDNADKTELAFADSVAKGHYQNVQDFERCQLLFRKSYIETKFYSVTREKPRALAPHEV